MAVPRRRSTRAPLLKPRKTPSQGRSQATVEAILQASAYILKKRGYAGLTTNGIAEKAGVNIASLYQYFPNKEAIFVELLRRHVVEGRQAATTILRRPRTSAMTKIRAVIDAAIATHAIEPELHRIFTTEAMRMNLPPFRTDADEQLTAETEQWIQGTKRKNAKLAAWITHTAVHAVIHSAFANQPDYAKSPELADELSQLVLRYLRA